MNCTACGKRISAADNVCQACGVSTRLPVRRDPAHPPSVWRQTAPIVARGAALIAAGIVGEWLIRSAARKAVTAPFSKKPRKDKAIARRGENQDNGDIIAVSETIVTRRMVYRR